MQIDLDKPQRARKVGNEYVAADARRLRLRGPLRG